MFNLTECGPVPKHKTWQRVFSVTWGTPFEINRDVTHKGKLKVT